MKQVGTLIIASIIGGLITLTGILLLNPNNQLPANNQSSSTFVSNKKYNSPKPVPFDFTVAAEKAMPVVVHIYAAESEKLANQRRQNEDNPLKDFFGDNFFFGNPNEPQKKGIGSGVIISRDGYIVTNNHVVEFADEVEVTLFDNRTYNAKVIGTYPKADLAVIKIDESGLPTLDYADSDVAKIGQWVLAVGNPLELTSTVTAGIISAKGRDINIIKGAEAIESFIQTDAAVNPGNSGGALVDAQGRLLGINTAIATRTGYYTGYSFAIPVNVMKKIVEDIIEFGSYQNGILGVSVWDLNNDLAQELGLNITKGVVVKELTNGCGAQYAGIIPNDVIISVDGKKINSFPDLQEKVSSVKIGDTLKLIINRNGEEKTISVKIRDCDPPSRF